MGNNPYKKNSDDEKKKLLDNDFSILSKINSELNIFICGKYQISDLYNKFTGGYNKKISKNNYEKNKCGINYNKTKNKYGKSYWKFYELSPIKSSNECEKLKNLIEKR